MSFNKRNRRVEKLNNFQPRHLIDCRVNTLILHPIFLEGCVGSNLRLSLDTSQSANKDHILRGQNLKLFNQSHQNN